jgi:hypothetical protein
MTYANSRGTMHAVQCATEIGVKLGAGHSQARLVGTAWLLSFGYDASMDYINAGIEFYCLAYELYASGISGDDLAAIPSVAKAYNAMSLSLEHVQLAVASVQCGA